MFLSLIIYHTYIFGFEHFLHLIRGCRSGKIQVRWFLSIEQVSGESKKYCENLQNELYKVAVQNTNRTAPPTIRISYPCLLKMSASFLSSGVKIEWNSGVSSFMVKGGSLGYTEYDNFGLINAERHRRTLKIDLFLFWNR